MLTPSSNTVLEPLSAAMTNGLAEISLHVSRLRVREISLEGDALRQFELEPFLCAAELLADARVHAMGWNGTSASWVGFDSDRRLCAAIEARFGIPATSAVLAVNALLERCGARRIALVTPYIDEVQLRIAANYRAAGFDVVAQRHSGERVNYAFAAVSDESIERMLREVGATAPEAIVIMCTNLRGAHLAEVIEAELDTLVIDSVSAFVWAALALAGADPGRVRGWGRLFALGPGPIATEPGMARN